MKTQQDLSNLVNAEEAKYGGTEILTHLLDTYGDICTPLYPDQELYILKDGETTSEDEYKYWQDCYKRYGEIKDLSDEELQAKGIYDRDCYVMDFDSQDCLLTNFIF